MKQKGCRKNGVLNLIDHEHAPSNHNYLI